MVTIFGVLNYIRIDSGLLGQMGEFLFQMRKVFSELK